jgi:hypothetical protein
MSQLRRYITIGYSTVAIHSDDKGLRMAFVEVQVPEDSKSAAPLRSRADAYNDRGEEVSFDTVQPLSRGLFI